MIARTLVASLAAGVVMSASLAAIAAPLAVEADGIKAPAAEGAIVVAASEQKYFVILGSFKKKADAQKRCGRFAEAEVVDTDDYSNFRGGYYSCVIGPYSKALANEVLADYRHEVSDAYVKAGW
ncbi:MAG: SPOR domain-containing protein [Hyphomicrobiales bacterium]